MSRASKTFFGASVLFGIISIGGVHLIQQQERETMFAGVLRDDARMAAKRAQRAREAEFEEQARKRAYLESVQEVSNPVAPAPPLKGEVPQSADGMDFGCKTCEK
ncbi:hypothetical protein BCR35DRAFT_297930 [Leucosporidium creatinivorum]|uniref:Cytochrome c oxidase assembly protein n=1 Tax=Leucosporidium creatinivorum TaxID=106004 RepID=A0A1Y2G3G9_9BASI|nr:hypothetical protein BCR35DRAFT_297930 [Leucosporidium creatinivorum]